MSNTFAESAVTPAKRSGGLKIGTIPSSTFGTTGNKSITGLGFKPRLVRFDVSSSSGSTSIYAYGVMDESGTQYAFSTSTNGSAAARLSRTNSCILTTSSGGTQDVNYEAAYVSMDSDGFTINVTTAGGAHDMNYMAFA